MKTSQVAADMMDGTFGMLKSALSDFSDADFLVRPCPGANHTAWQLGHLISVETAMINGITPGAIPALPEGFDKKFTKETSSKDDPAFFPTRGQLLDQYYKTRAAVTVWVKKLSPEDLDKPCPERIKSMAPTVGHLLYLYVAHMSMHLGQVQVVRRKLGKPVLF